MDRRGEEPRLPLTRENFGEFYETYWDRTLSRIYRHTGDRSAAEELAQDVFRKAFEGLDTYQDQGLSGGWLQRITSNVLTDHYRASDKLTTIESGSEDREDSDRANQPGVAEDAIDLAAILDLLPEGDRDVIDLYCLQDLSALEVGERLGMSAARVRMRKYRIIKKLSNPKRVKPTKVKKLGVRSESKESFPKSIYQRRLELITSDSEYRALKDRFVKSFDNPVMGDDDRHEIFAAAALRRRMIMGFGDYNVFGTDEIERRVMEIDDRLKVDFEGCKAYIGGEPAGLTPIEFKLLALFAYNRGFVLGHQEILSFAWGRAAKNDRHLLRTGLSRLRGKIEVDPEKPQYIINKLSVGYLMELPKSETGQNNH